MAGVGGLEDIGRKFFLEPGDFSGLVLGRRASDAQRFFHPRGQRLVVQAGQLANGKRTDVLVRHAAGVHRVQQFGGKGRLGCQEVDCFPLLVF